ncbi:hypothetical protein VM1G_08034 [Cytospora mali]|uniref:Uncharacterized protein n=1 Tax=Cytospora mali TaxID=578113 RepID=A0A194W5W4_CYTMA|nr:hypothetical protein VM1G_08034 [Valsa mali]
MPLTLSPAPIHPPLPEVRDTHGGSAMNDDIVNEPDLNSVKFAMPLDQEIGSNGEEDAPGEEVSDEEWRERECQQQQQATEVSVTLQQGDEFSETILDEKPVPETGRKADVGLSEGGRMSKDESFKAKGAAQVGSTSWTPSDAEPFNTPGQATAAYEDHAREPVKNNNPNLQTLETPQATSQIFKRSTPPLSNLAQHTAPAEASQPGPDDYIPDHMIEPFMDILQSHGHEVAHIFLRQMRSRRKMSRKSGQRNTAKPKTPGLSVARSNFTSSVDAPNAPRRSGIGQHHGESFSLQPIFDSPDDDPDSQAPAFHRLLTPDGAVIADDPGVYGITEIWNSKGVRVAKGSSSRTHNDNDQTPTLNRQVIDIHIEDDLVGAAKVDAPVEKFRWLMSSSPLASRSSNVLPEGPGLAGGLGSPSQVCGNTRGGDAVVGDDDDGGDDGGDVELVEGKDVGAGGSRSVNLLEQEDNDDNNDQD